VPVQSRIPLTPNRQADKKLCLKSVSFVTITESENQSIRAQHLTHVGGSNHTAFGVSFSPPDLPSREDFPRAHGVCPWFVCDFRSCFLLRNMYAPSTQMAMRVDIRCDYDLIDRR